MTFFALFSLVDLIILSVIFLGMLGSVWADDRGGTDVAKWWVVIIAIGVVAVMYWSSWTFSSVFDYLTSAAFLKLLAAYIGIGIAYAVVKFLIKTRSVADAAGRMWNTWLDDRQVYNAQGNDVVTNQHLFEQFRQDKEKMDPRDIKHQIRQLISSLNDLCEFFRFRLDNGVITYASPQVRTVRSRLTDYLGAWIIFWPLYLLVNVLGDFIEAVVSLGSRVIMKLTAGVVRSMFDRSFTQKK